MRFSAWLVVLLALTTPALAGAQSDSLATRSLSGAAAQMAALARLQPGNTLRLHVLGQGWLSGSLTRNYVDSLVLSSNEHERVVPTAFMDSVLVKHGHARMGAGLGGLAGMLVGASVRGCEQPPATSLGDAAAGIGSQMECAMGHAMAGLVVGALIGAIIGEATASWEHRVPVEPEERPAAEQVLDAYLMRSR
jgi:hypothetical protein